MLEFKNGFILHFLPNASLREQEPSMVIDFSVLQYYFADSEVSMREMKFLYIFRSRYDKGCYTDQG